MLLVYVTKLRNVIHQKEVTFREACAVRREVRGAKEAQGFCLRRFFSGTFFLQVPE